MKSKTKKPTRHPLYEETVRVERVVSAIAGRGTETTTLTEMREGGGVRGRRRHPADYRLFDQYRYGADVHEDVSSSITFSQEDLRMEALAPYLIALVLLTALWLRPRVYRRIG